MPKWIQAEVIRIEQRSETTRSFWLELEGVDNFQFKPGQFITLDLPIGEKRLEKWRSYSIASAPNGDNIIELVIVKVPFGKATSYLFGLEKGARLILKGPGGVFCLPSDIKQSLVFISTGTGVAPFRSMVQSLKAQKDFPPIHLIFGTRHKEGILYLDEWERLSEEVENFSFDIALSREEYKGYQGYVHELYKKRYSEVNEQILFYLCGWQNMVDEARENLIALGYNKDQIIEELYG